MFDIKPVFKYTNGQWTQLEAFERQNGIWVRISRPSGQYPVKGDLLALDLDGNRKKQYRVLKINGSVATLLYMSDDISFTTSQQTGTFDGGTKGQVYANSDMDTYLNTTWYNTLTNIAKAAIVATTIEQKLFDEGSSYSSSATYTGSAYGGTEYYKQLDKKAIGSRYIYPIGLDEIIEYTGNGTTNFNQVTMRKMFWNATKQKSDAYGAFFIRDAAKKSSDDVNCKYYSYCWANDKNLVNVDRGFANTQTFKLRPVFSIDLSKITDGGGYSVSCSTYEEEAGYEYQYSNDNGSTWNNITGTGLIVSATQIKFRIHNMSPSGTPSVTKKQIKSTLLGLNISMTTESTDIESENFTLTEDINDIQCFSALGYDVTITVQTEVGMETGIAVKFNDAPADSTDYDYHTDFGGGDNSDLYNSQDELVETPKIVSDVRKMYIMAYNANEDLRIILNGESMSLTDKEIHEYDITQNTTLVLIKLWN